MSKASDWVRPTYSAKDVNGREIRFTVNDQGGLDIATDKDFIQLRHGSSALLVTYLEDWYGHQDTP